MKNKKRTFINKFNDRLNKNLSDFIISHIDNNEYSLAMETLCDYMNEFDIQITEREFDEIIELAVGLNLDVCTGRFLYLKKLIR